MTTNTLMRSENVSRFGMTKVSNTGTARQVRCALDAVKLFCVERLAAQQTSSRSGMTGKRKSVTPKSKRMSRPTPHARTFDAFMAYNSVDKLAVQKIVGYLRKNG